MGFVEESFEEIPDLEKQKILSDEKVKALISQKSARISEKKYGDVTIRFRTSVTKSLRKRLVRAKKYLENESGVEEFLYETLAVVCVDEPFNDARTWAVYDGEQTEDGIGALEIFTDIMSEISRQTEMVKGFR